MNSEKSALPSNELFVQLERPSGLLTRQGKDMFQRKLQQTILVAKMGLSRRHQWRIRIGRAPGINFGPFTVAAYWVASGV